MEYGKPVGLIVKKTTGVMKRIGIALLVLFVCSNITLSQKGKESELQPSIGKSLPFTPPKIITDSLPNGIKILFARTNSIPLIEINAIINAGFSKEPEGKTGISQVTSKMLFGGTENRTAAQIAADLSLLGSTITTFASYDYSQVYARTLNKNFRQTVDILADICMGARLSERNLNQQINKLRISRSYSESNPGEQASKVMLTSMYGENHPYTRSLFSSGNSLDELSLEDVETFYNNHYIPENTCLIVVGDIDYDAARIILLDRFGGWKNVATKSDVSEYSAPDLGRRAVVIDNPELKVARIRYGFPGIDRRKKEFYPALVLNHLLGNGRNARLNKNIWGDRIVHPYFLFSSAMGFFTHNSYFVITGSITPNRIDSVLHAIDNSIREMMEGKVSPDDLAEAKKYLLAGHEYEFDTNKKMQKHLQDAAVHRLKVAEIRKFPEIIESIYPADIQAVARRIFGNGCVFVTTGDAEKLAPVLRKHYGDNVQVMKEESGNETRSSSSEESGESEEGRENKSDPF